MKKKIAIVILVGLLVAAIAVPAFAALKWQHEWDHRSIVFEIPKGDGYNARTEGHSGWVGLNATKLLDKSYGCSGAYSPRVVLYAEADEDVRVMVGCAVMTPTPAPPMQP